MYCILCAACARGCRGALPAGLVHREQIQPFLQDFAKAGASTRYMPFWSWQELDAGRHLYGLREDEILPLYERWGGSAR